MTADRGVLEWLQQYRSANPIDVQPLTWDACIEWDLESGTLMRPDGCFFTVVGGRIQSTETAWDGRAQPFIDQPEIGILGFLGRRAADGSVEILLQAKTEPGNVGGTQAGPTVQATRSNYLKVHRGRPTPFLGSFLEPDSDATVSDVEQSEQGTVFLGKYNRNAVIQVRSVVEVPGDRYAWHSIREVGRALTEDFLVNTDARSVLASTSWAYLASPARPFSRWRGSGQFGEEVLNSYESGSNTSVVAAWLSEQRLGTSVLVMPSRLDHLPGWKIADTGCEEADGTRGVGMVGVVASDREVSRWCQPLVGDSATSRVVLICQRRDGILWFLTRASLEPGFREGRQLGPTVQSNHRYLASGEVGQFALEAGTSVLAVDQSEEGGRFWQTISRYDVRLLEDDDVVPRSDDAIWLTLGQLEDLSRQRAMVTNELRSLLSLILSLI